MIYGTYIWPWRILTSAGADYVSMFRQLSSACEVHLESRDKSFLWSRAVHLVQDRGCSDLWDKVFAIQKLFPSAMHIQVDYQQSIQGVFEEAAIKLIPLFGFSVGAAALLGLAVGMNLLEKAALVRNQPRRTSLRRDLGYLVGAHRNSNWERQKDEHRAGPKGIIAEWLSRSQMSGSAPS